MEETTRQILKTLAREARHAPTAAENALWERLRDHRCGDLHFRRQDIIGPFRLDFYCRRANFAVEVDGSIHAVSSVQRRDAAQQQILEQEFGICFLRVTNADVLHNMEKVIMQIQTRAAELTCYSSTPID